MKNKLIKVAALTTAIGAAIYVSTKNVNDLRLSKKGTMELISLEGLSQTRYLDSTKHWTICVGHTSFDKVSPNPDKMKNGEKLSINDCLKIFNETIKSYENTVNNNVKVKLTQSEFDALVSFQYNTGGLSNSTLLRYINSNKSDSDIRKAFMLWTKQKELITRRTKEANLYIDGVYSNDGYSDLIYVDPKTNKPIYSKSSRLKLVDYLKG